MSEPDFARHLFIAADYASRAEQALRAEMDRVRVISFD